METDENVTALVEEYRGLLEQAAQDHPNTLSQELENLLVRDCEWTPSAAEHLLRLANDYGVFMLRNALALSLVLGIEDGELGF